MKISQEDRKQVKKVLVKFKNIKTVKETFYNLCFCILVPQTKFSKVLKVIERLKYREFFTTKIERKVLAKLIEESRYKNRKANYLLELKENFFETIKDIRCFASDIVKRQILEKTVKGMGMKSASHFLRNMGATDLAIIDTHILKFLKIKERKFDYLTAEEKFRKIAKKLKLSVAELDAIIWKKYSGTDWKDFVY